MADFLQAVANCSPDIPQPIFLRTIKAKPPQSWCPVDKKELRVCVHSTAYVRTYSGMGFTVLDWIHTLLLHRCSSASHILRYSLPWLLARPWAMARSIARFQNLPNECSLIRVEHAWQSLLRERTPQFWVSSKSYDRIDTSRKFSDNHVILFFLW